MKKCYFLWAVIIIALMFSGCVSSLRLRHDRSVATREQKSSFHPTAVEHFIRGCVDELRNDYRSALLEFSEALLYDSSSATIYNKVAENYIHLKKIDSAQKMLLSTIRRFPDNIHSYRMLAAIYSSQRDIIRAEQAYKKIIALDPNDLEARYNLIALYLANGKDLKVAEEYEKIIALGYGTPEMWIRVGTIYVENKAFAKAEKIFNNFYSQFPEDERAYLALANLCLTKKDTLAAIAWYQKGLNQDLSFETCLEELRDLYIHQKKWDQAMLLLQQVIARDSSHVENYLRLGEVYYQYGDTMRAIKEFRHVIDLFPDDFRAYFSLGSLYFQTNNADSSEQYLKKSLELNTKFPRAWILVGFLYFRQQRLEQAEDHFKQAIELFPDSPAINFYYGTVLNQRHKSDDAIPYLEKCILLDPNHVEAMGTLAMIYDEKKIYQKSDSLYQAALKSRPDDPLLMNNYSYSLSVRGINLDEALEMAQKAVAADSTNGAFLDTLGWIYFKQGLYHKALDYISNAVKYRSNSAEVMEHLGDVYEKLNDPQNARIYWKKALELDATRTELLKKLGEK